MAGSRLTPFEDDLDKDHKTDNQVVGNAGLFLVCYELSKRGWNVLPTSRNARGIDVVIYDREAKRRHTIQVKALSKRNPVPMGNKKENLLADYLVICRRVLEATPEIFVTTIDEIRGKIHEVGKEGEHSYWLEPKEYESFKGGWDKIGS
ncbi:MAG TPA: hypothetical protein VGS11_01040 [Candidatus Bathyarchaeia archaeon]|nr:hypothetical protein [Candidatus Bathyarchaeia archaeon]